MRRYLMDEMSEKREHDWSEAQLSTWTFDICKVGAGVEGTDSDVIYAIIAFAFVGDGDAIYASAVLCIFSIYIVMLCCG